MFSEGRDVGVAHMCNMNIANWSDFGVLMANNR